MSLSFLKVIAFCLLASFISCKKKPTTENPPVDSLGNGLLAYYPFSGNTNDQTGRNSTGAINNATITADASGKSNSAYSFNGTDSYIAFTPADTLKKIQTISISVKLFSEASNGGNFIFGWTGDPNGTPKIRHSLFLPPLGSSPYCLFVLTDPTFCTSSGSTSASSVDNITQNQWHTLTGVYNGNALKIYLDGVLKEQKPITLPFVPSCTSDQVILLGRPNPNYHQSFKGKIDELRIYNRELTQEEITRLASL